MSAVITQNPEDNRIYTSIGFDEGKQHSQDNPDATMVAFMWTGVDEIVLTEFFYEIENPPDD